MSNQLAADLVVLLHFAFIVFVVFGGLFVFRWPWIAWLHLPAAAWGAFIELSGGICPLTPLENRLRAAADGDTYAGDFIDHYIMPVIYPSGLTHQIQIAFGIAVLILNGIIYGLWLARRRRCPPCKH
ncbi:DUF2784 domain-containing protein [Methylobacter marinus]|uniref:DUF2784 domain-containing protein n=1 Tax=Methylobacter marinus TaxID=34058 RepID=UPI00037777D3|nr:DUF2784 domain-containing protein [Methylobacter marinus]